MSNELRAITETVYWEWHDEQKARARMKTEERAREAGALLASMFDGAKWTARIQEFDGKNHDLDLVWPTGQRHAVEVTRSVSSHQRVFEDKIKLPCDSDCLTGHWHVEVNLVEGDNLSTKKLEQRAAQLAEALNNQLEQCLVDVEASLKRRGTWPSSYEHYKLADFESPEPQLHKRLADLQIAHLWCTPDPACSETGSFEVTRHFAGGSFAPTNFTDEAKRWIEEKHEQLANAREQGDYAATHLFVWLPRGGELDRNATAVAVNETMLPTLTPDIDRKGIASVWVAIQDGTMSMPIDDRQPHERLEGFKGLVWQLDDTGWHCWRRGWLSKDAEVTSG